MSRTLRTVALAAAVGSLLAVSPASAASQKTYQAPFKIGPSGGDSWSYHSASTGGTVTVGRVYPVPGAINCTKGGPWAKLRVSHRATRQVRKVVLSYDQAAVDNFTFAMLTLRGSGARWFGTKTVRGLVAGSGTITLVPDRQTGRFPQTFTVEFGLQQSSACPNADAGTIHFSKVQVFS